MENDRTENDQQPQADGLGKGDPAMALTMASGWSGDLVAWAMQRVGDLDYPETLENAALYLTGRDDCMRELFLVSTGWMDGTSIPVQICRAEEEAEEAVRVLNINPPDPQHYLGACFTCFHNGRRVDDD